MTIVSNLPNGNVRVVITNFPTLSSATTAPTGITAGPDKRLYFTEYGVARIGVITTNGVVGEYTNGITHFANYPGAIPPFITNNPVNITAGPDGNLWFTEEQNSLIGRLNPVTGAVTEFPLPTNCYPTDIVSDGANSIWFTEVHSNLVGRITVSGTNGDRRRAPICRPAHHLHQLRAASAWSWDGTGTFILPSLRSTASASWRRIFPPRTNSSSPPAVGRSLLSRRRCGWQHLVLGPERQLRRPEFH